jgi:transposase-like protein
LKNSSKKGKKLMSQTGLSSEQKEQIIHKVTQEGKRASVVAADYGISPRTVYGILGTHAKKTGQKSSETQLRKENQMLKELVANLSLEISKSKKKRGDK